MSISCGCDYDGGDEFAWYYHINAPKPLETKRSRKCCSCSERIHPGKQSSEVVRWRNPRDEIEEKIYGNGGEISVSSWYLCPHCSGLAEIIQNQGACFDIGYDIESQLIEFITDGEECRDGGDPAAHLLSAIFSKYVDGEI